MAAMNVCLEILDRDSTCTYQVSICDDSGNPMPAAGIDIGAQKKSLREGGKV
jgi:hypothetical protein